MIQRLVSGLIAILCCLSLSAQEWDSVVGAVGSIDEPTPHWFTLRGYNITYLVNGDTAEVEGTLTLSMFSPALRPQIDKDRIYSYGSFYTRTYYGERTDVVLIFDSNTLAPIAEVEIPAKSAGLGHGGMIGLIDDKFLGIWNITPAMSVSIVDVDAEEFVGEVSTPGCAAVYPIDRGFLMPCGDGTLQYISLDRNGKESGRIRSRVFFNVDEDPIFDYAVPTTNGWMFMSFDGLVFEASVANGEITISEPWSIISQDEEDAQWRISGGQPFAYNAATGVLVTLMHEGGGQETFEDPGTQVWGFDTNTRRRGYRMELGEEMATGVALTADAEPLLIIVPDEQRTLRIASATTGRILRTMDEMGGGLVQNLLPAE
jgi:methylamine dehydrogenase heavy chain